MFDLIVHSNVTVLVRCETAKDQVAVILDCQKWGFDYEVPSSSSLYHREFTAQYWLDL